MKKFISIVSALIVASSMIASASAFSYDASNYVITDLPTKTELESRTPNIALSASPITTVDEVKAAGVGSMQAKNYISDAYDTYVVTMTASNLGDLAVGYTDDTYETKQGICMPCVSITIKDDSNIKKFTSVKPTFIAKTAMAKGTNEKIGDHIAISWGDPTNTDYSYPTYETTDDGDFGNEIKNATVTGKMVICVTKGTSVEVKTLLAEVTYIRKVGEAAQAVILNPTVAPITLAPAATGPSYEITNFYDDPTENGDRGYVWDVTISDFNTTKNSAMANFKVSDDEKVSAEITGLDGIESDGSCNFAVILNTEKTLAATDGFTITFPAK